jgi:capsular polysaccharide biosynthesis protein
VNQDKVIEFLRQMGATVISPENLPVEEQRELFSNADIVTGMAGSALANTIFCRPEASAILICQDEIVSPEYFGLMFGELGLNYAVVSCPAVADSNPHPSHRSVTVDMAALRQALEFVTSKQRVVT